MYILVHVSVLLETLLKVSWFSFSLVFLKETSQSCNQAWGPSTQGKIFLRNLGFKTMITGNIFLHGLWLNWQNNDYLSKGNCSPERKWRLPLLHNNVMYCFSMLQQFLGEDPCETKSESSASYNNLPLIIYFSCVCQLFRDAYWFLGVTLHQVVNMAN